MNESTMAESLCEVPSSVEALGATDDGKKKFKFKVLKSLFGKEKYAEEGQEGRVLKSGMPGVSMSTSSLKEVPEIKAMDCKVKSSMGAKAISHDSVFSLESEHDKSVGALGPSQELRRCRSLQISKEYEEMFESDDKALQSPMKQSSSIYPSSPEKSDSEQSLESDQSQSSPSSSQQPSDFSTPATIHRCLDSSAARHKMALNPRKQKTVCTTERVKQEEPQPPVVSKEKATVKPKPPESKKRKRDSMGPPSQKQSSKTESQEKKPQDQTPGTDVIMSIECSASGANIRRCRRRAKNEWGFKERSLLQSSTQGRDASLGAKFSSTEEIDSGEPSVTQLRVEKQATGQLTTPEAEITAAQESSDKADAKKQTGNFKAKRAPVPPVPRDMAESVESGPPAHHEDETSGAKKKKDRASFIPWVGRSTTQEEALVSKVAEAQPHIKSEGEESSAPSMQKFLSKIEIALEVPSKYKEKHPQNVSHTLSANASSTTSSTPEGEVCIKRWPSRSLSQHLKQQKEDTSSDSKSTSEYASCSEVQLVTRHSSRPTWKPKEKEITIKTGSLDTKLSNLEQQLPLCSSKFLGKLKTEEAFTGLWRSSEKQKKYEEVASSHSSQSLEEFEECSESRSFIMASVSEEQLAPRSHLRVLQDFGEEFSPESCGYLEQYNSSEEMSSSEGDQLQGHLKHRSQLKVSSASKSTLKSGSASGKMKLPRIPSPVLTSPTAQQQASTSANTAVGQSTALEPVPLSDAAKSWMSPTSGHVDPAKLADDWNIFLQPLPPRKSTRHLKGSKAEQNISTLDKKEAVSVEAGPPRGHCQLPTRPTLEQEVSAGTETAIVEEKIGTQLPRSTVRPNVKKEVFLGAESAGFEGSVSKMKPLSSKHRLHQVCAFERYVSVVPRPPKHLPARSKPQVKPVEPSFLESVDVEGDSSAQPLFSNLPQLMMQPKAYQSLPSEYESITAKPASMEPAHSRYPSQPLPNPPGQEISESTKDSESTSAQSSSPTESISAQPISQPQENPPFKQVSADKEKSANDEKHPLLPPFTRSPSKLWLSPSLEQIPELLGSASALWGITTDPSLPRNPLKSLMGSVVKQPVSEKSVSTSPNQSSSVESVPSRVPSQLRGSPMFKEQTPTELESYVASDALYVKPRRRRHRSQPALRSEVKVIAPALMRASRDWSGLMGPVPSKYVPQLWSEPEYEQQSFSSPEGVATEGAISRKLQLSRHPSQTIINQKVHKIVSYFESSTAEEGGIPPKPLPPKCPTPYLMRSKVQEMSLRLESAAAQEGSSKKPVHTRAPSQTFVKFMAEQIFSESPPEEEEEAIYTKIVPRNLRSKSLVKPKQEEQVYLPHRGDDQKGDIPLRKLSPGHSFQSSERPKGPEEVLSYSEGVPVKCSSSKGQVPVGEFSQPLEMPEASLPLSYPERELSSRQPPQALDVSDLQSPSLSTSSLNAPVKWRGTEGHLNPTQLGQSLGVPEYHQQHLYSSFCSVSGAAEGSASERSSGRWSARQVLASPKKTMKHSQVYGEFQKTPTSATKPGQFAPVPTQKTPISESTYSTEEELKNRDGSKSPSILTTSKVDVENVFGVRLRTVLSRKGDKGYQYEKPQKLDQPPFGPILSLTNKEQRMKRSSFQGFRRTSDKLSQTPSFEGMQQSRPKYEGGGMKQGVYRPSEMCYEPKTEHSTTETAWISMAKERQRKYEQKPRTRAEARAETKEPRCGITDELTLQALGKEVEALPRNYSSCTPAQEIPQIRQSKHKKSVGFQEQRMFCSVSQQRETK